MVIKRCTAAPSVALELYHGRDPKPYTVSQSLSVQFLEPSKLYVLAGTFDLMLDTNSWAIFFYSGDRLRLVSTTVVVGGRVRTMYCEVPMISRMHSDRLQALNSPICAGLGQKPSQACRNGNACETGAQPLEALTAVFSCPYHLSMSPSHGPWESLIQTGAKKILNNATT